MSFRLPTLSYAWHRLPLGNVSHEEEFIMKDHLMKLDSKGTGRGQFHQPQEFQVPHTSGFASFAAWERFPHTSGFASFAAWDRFPRFCYQYAFCPYSHNFCYQSAFCPYSQKDCRISPPSFHVNTGGSARKFLNFDIQNILNYFCIKIISILKPNT